VVKGMGDTFLDLAGEPPPGHPQHNWRPLPPAEPPRACLSAGRVASVTSPPGDTWRVVAGCGRQGWWRLCPPCPREAQSRGAVPAWTALPSPGGRAGPGADCCRERRPRAAWPGRVWGPVRGRGPGQTSAPLRAGGPGQRHPGAGARPAAAGTRRGRRAGCDASRHPAGRPGARSGADDRRAATPCQDPGGRGRPRGAGGRQA
jgi:hypothetical protein